MQTAKENHAIFVCENPSAMRYKAKAYGIEDLICISYLDFITEEYQYENFVVDELEKFLSTVLIGYQKLVGYSLTTGD